VRKHANVNQATIRLEREANHICIRIEDEGQGFDAACYKKENTSSFGMQIMQERIEKIGGRLDIESNPDQGTRVTLYYRVKPAKKASK
jgi:signal transduction histidine kinase